MKQTIFDNRILIVDDNAELRAMLFTFLSREGYQKIDLAEDCRTALQNMRALRPDLVILDVNLPDGDGFFVMRKMKEDAALCSVPVLFLSARDKDADRLCGLGLGADDYMVKPFLPKELLLRMAAILKRSYSYEQSEAAGPDAYLQSGAGDRAKRHAGSGAFGGALRISDGAAAAAAYPASTSSGENDPGASMHGAADWNRTGMEYDYFSEEQALPGKISLGARTVDFEAGTVFWDGAEEKLTVKELKILETLARSRGKIVTFDNLCKAVWNAQYYTYENTVMVHIRRLREKIEDDPSHPQWLVTARGIGYKLNQEKPVRP